MTETDAAGNVLQTAAYGYDLYNRRIAKVIDPDGAGAALATTERFVYNNEHIALVFDGNGQQTHRYLHGPRIDQVLAEETPTGQVVWALADHQGTVRDWVDSQGVVINHLSYDSFGNLTHQTNPTAFFRFGYTGREHDPETGYIYYRNRYTFKGRFISQDPLSFAAGDTNLYRYVNNSPINATDPLGLQAQELPNPVVEALKAVIGAAIGAISDALQRTQFSPESRIPESIRDQDLNRRPSRPPVPAPFPESTREPRHSAPNPNNCKCKAYPVPRRGGNKRHDTYATQVSGSTMDYYVETPEGLGRAFDGLTPNTRWLWEAKTGHSTPILFDPTGLEKRNTEMLSKIVYQALDQVKISKRCNYSLVWAFDTLEVANFVRNIWKGNPNYPQDVRWIKNNSSQK